MRIVIGSDLAPTIENQHLFIEKKIKENLDDVLCNIWYNADFRVINLESVLADKELVKPHIKAGPNIIASEKCIAGIKELEPNLLLLANNHILDYGIDGLDNTLQLLDENKISYTGIISNTKEEMKPFLLEKDGVKVGIYNVCENEFSVADIYNKGANPFIESKSYYEIMSNKKYFDKIIVIFHGGKEYYRYPSPNLQRIARAFIDFGADLVIVQHTHCIGCREIYLDKEILYGQGNFIFNNDTYSENSNIINTSLLVELVIDKENFNVNYVPLERKNKVINYSSDNSILEEFFKRSLNLKNEKIIHEEYEKFANSYLNAYLLTLNRKTFFHRLINRIFKRKYFERVCTLNDYLGILNIIECEAHRELLIKGLKNQINKNS